MENRLVIAASVLLAAALFAISAIQYASFTREKLYDLGEFDGALWNTLHGRPLHDDAYEGSLLQRHLFLTLPLLLPFYLLCPHPLLLLGLQAIAIASTVPLVARLARAAGVPPALPVLLVLLHPGVVNLVATDFHPDAFALPLCAWLVIGLEEGRPRIAAAAALAAVATKEDLVPTVAALAAAYLTRAASRRAAVLALAVAIAWGVLAFGFLMPALQPHGRLWQLDRYRPWGEGPWRVLTAPWHAPRAVFDHVRQPERLRYLRRLLLPLVPALVARPALAAVPTLYLSLLSTVWMQSSIDHWYHAPALGVLLPAVPLGLARLKRRSALAAHIAAAVALLAALYGLIDHSHARAFLQAAARGQLLNDHDAVGRRALALVPAGVPALIDNNYAAHAAHRHHIATGIYDPEPSLARDIVLLDTREGFLAEGWDPTHAGVQRALVQRFETDARYVKIFDEDGIMVWRRL